MIVKNSGKIYLFSLDFGFGYACFKFDDFTDVASFTGRIGYVYSIFFEKLENFTEINSIIISKILFGAFPLYREPNTRGKGAWKIIGKIAEPDITIPVFKMTNHTITLWKTNDWSKIDSWQKKYDFNSGSDNCDYEIVRNLEIPTLCSMREIEVRTTMNFLILNKKNVQDYYDLEDSDNRDIYLKMVNTSFDKKQALVLLKALSL